MYDEHKKIVAVALTPTAVKRLDALADSLDVSRSELIEQVARGTSPLISPVKVERLGKSLPIQQPSSATNSTEEDCS